MNILLTGATGFVGSHLLKALLEMGYNVTILKRSFSDCSRVIDLLGDCICYDLDRVSLEEIFHHHKFFAVIHSATCYGRKDIAVSEVIRTNYLFSLELLETSVKFGCNHFINTDSFFTKQLPDSFVQLHPIYRPEYTLTKYQFREWGRLRSIEGKINFTNLQMEHIYGPHDGKDKFLPYVIQEMKSGASKLDLTDGTQIRDFVHINDVVQAYIVILKKLNQFSGYQNFEVGSGNACTLREFIERIHHILNSETHLCFGAIPKSEAEIDYSVADITALQDLGWEANWSGDYTWVL